MYLGPVNSDGKIFTMSAPACQAVTTDMYALFQARNGEALRSLIEDHGVEVLPFPDDVLAELKRHSFDIVEELAATDQMVRETWESFRQYMENIKRWTDIGERYFLNHR